MEGISAILANLGFDFNVAILTTANFLFVLWILNKFVFSKLDQSLENRKQVLTESLQNADKLKIELAQAEQKAAEIVAEAHREASEFKTRGREEFDAWAAKAKADAENSIAHERKEMHAQLEVDRAEMLNGLKRDVANLAVEATARIIGEKFDGDRDKQIVEQYLDQLDNQKND